MENKENKMHVLVSTPKHFGEDLIQEYLKDVSHAKEKYVVMAPTYRVQEDLICTSVHIWPCSLKDLMTAISIDLNTTSIYFEGSMLIGCMVYSEKVESDCNYWSVYFTSIYQPKLKFLYGVIFTLDDFAKDIIYGPNEDGRFRQSLCLLEAADGFTLLTKRLSDGGCIYFRPVRGTLEESMKNLKTFPNVNEMKQYIINHSEQSLGGIHYQMNDIVIDKKGVNDDRTQWRSTHYVCVTHMGGEHFDVPACIGMCTFYSNTFGYVDDDVFERLMKEEGEWEK